MHLLFLLKNNSACGFLRGGGVSVGRSLGRPNTGPWATRPSHILWGPASRPQKEAGGRPPPRSKCRPRSYATPDPSDLRPQILLRTQEFEQAEKLSAWPTTDSADA